ncbi:unnamed protein product [Ilex paraguariensis]|uniref:EF-hand domain-containing protein n=1 Tax=Ilex paraguariensis TaxID=185542 RepID=A0ABC8SIH6_9AQUA
MPVTSAQLTVFFSLLHQVSKCLNVEKMIKEVDSYGDWFIDLHEFIVLNTKDIDSNWILENLKDVFLVFDIDKNEMILAEEL